MSAVRLDPWRNIVNVHWRSSTTTTTTEPPSSTSVIIPGTWIYFQSINGGSFLTDGDFQITSRGNLFGTPGSALITHHPGDGSCWGGFSRSVTLVCGAVDDTAESPDGHGYIVYFHRDTDPVLTFIPEGTTTYTPDDYDDPGTCAQILYTPSGTPLIPSDVYK